MIRWLLPYALAACLLLTASACADDGTGPTPSPTTGTSAAPSAAPSSPQAQTKTPQSTPTPPGAVEFTFAAAGDHGANPNTEATLAALDGSGVSFYLALGDIDYDQTASDAAWCEYVRRRLPALGPEFPFQLVAGNHEHDHGSHGNVLDHAACLPDRLGSTGTYGVEYFFDYPPGDPLLRVIMIAPGLTVSGVTYDFNRGTPHYNWLAAAIDGAKERGIPWIAVGMHYVCLTAGVKSCEAGVDLTNLLLEKKVDLVLQGHDHNYQRSKQLALNGGACPSLVPGTFNSGCVVDNGADGVYAKGAGAIFVIAGTFGLCCYGLNADDPEAGYFAAMGGTSHGFTQFRVSAGDVEAQFVPSSGSFRDSFAIRE